MKKVTLDEFEWHAVQLILVDVGKLTDVRSQMLWLHTMHGYIEKNLHRGPREYPDRFVTIEFRPREIETILRFVASDGGHRELAEEISAQAELFIEGTAEPAASKR